VRLLEGSLIAPQDLERKFKHELHANEIVLLAYHYGMSREDISNRCGRPVFCHGFTPARSSPARRLRRKPSPC